MKKLKTLIIILSCFATCAYGQLGERIVQTKVNVVLEKLKVQGVDTIISYHPYCVGCMISGNSESVCFPLDWQYLVWTKNGKNMIQLFDNCFDYEPLINISDAFVKIYKDHLAQIVNEEIKPVT